ncbi:MAG: rhomboid family intramembrane serine protease [Phycisphaeraceae bacterium]|nr:MAG: rhomboid family intramembrane serine protease [Phycisphaeraceae bacterium]
MGLADRDYVRNEPRPRGMAPTQGGGIGRLRMLSVNTWLIIINIAVFLIEANLPQLVPANGYPPGDAIFQFGHFSTAHVFGLEVWRLLTFQFLHASFTHILFNMIGLWIFGSLVEQYLGPRKYLAYYLVCGIFGGLAYLLLNLLGRGLGLSFPGVLINDMRTPLVGASAGVFGVIMACAYISPNTIVQLLFPPIPLKMRTLAYGYVALAAFNLFIGKGHNQGGDAAHMGGAVAGYFFIRNSHLLTDFFDIFNDSRKNPGKSAGRRPRSRGTPSDADVDRVLAKVQKSGLHALSDREKSILREASRSRGS